MASFAELGCVLALAGCLALRVRCVCFESIVFGGAGTKEVKSAAATVVASAAGNLPGGDLVDVLFGFADALSFSAVCEFVSEKGFLKDSPGGLIACGVPARVVCAGATNASSGARSGCLDDLDSPPASRRFAGLPAAPPPAKDPAERGHYGREQIEYGRVGLAVSVGADRT